jgi:Sulfatase
MDKALGHDGPGGAEDCISGRANAKTGGESLSALTNSTTRRGLFRAGAGLAAAVSGITPGRAAPAAAADAIKVPNRPNIIVLMTDQERHHMHWPQGWAEKNLPGLQRLKRHGLYFNRAYTAASQCSPSRAVMTTGRFAPVNRVTRTFLWPGLVHQNRQPNIASLLRDKAGYEVVCRKANGTWATPSTPHRGTAARIGGKPTSPRLRRITAGRSGTRPMRATQSCRCSPTSSGHSTGSRPWAVPIPTMTVAM